MSEKPQPAEKPKRRFYHPTPGKLIAGLLVVELLLLLADRFSLFGLQRGSGWNVIWAVAIFLGVILVGLGWFLLALVLRKRFQFGILSLFGLMCVVAVVSGRFSWKWRMANSQAAAVETMDALGSVRYDYEQDEKGEWIQHAEPSGPPWLRKLIGIDFFAKVTVVRICRRQYLDLTDGQMKHFQNLADLTHLRIRGCRASAFHNLRGLTKLEHLWLSLSTVTDSDLEYIEGMASLKELHLHRTKITDAGLEHLKGMAKLERLHLGDTQISDAGLEHLQGLAALEQLDVTGTQVSDEGVKRLQLALPNCEIWH